jgi:hypothetical protein
LDPILCAWYSIWGIIGSEGLSSSGTLKSTILGMTNLLFPAQGCFPKIPTPPFYPVKKIMETVFRETSPPRPKPEIFCPERFLYYHLI